MKFQSALFILAAAPAAAFTTQSTKGSAFVGGAKLGLRSPGGCFTATTDVGGLGMPSTDINFSCSGLLNADQVLAGQFICVDAVGTI